MQKYSPPLLKAIVRATVVILTATSTACDQIPGNAPNARADTAAVIRVILESRLRIEDSLSLNRRLLPADTLGFMPPFSSPYESLPASPLLAEVASEFQGITLAPVGRPTADTAYILSVSHPVFFGDSALIYWASSHFDRYWYGGYWAAFFRADLIRIGNRWRIVRAGGAGHEG